eukprot:g30317.t1
MNAIILRRFMLHEATAHSKPPEAEYEVLLLQFVGGVIVTLKETQDGHVTQGVGVGMGRGFKMVLDRKVLSFVACRAQMLYKKASESPLSLTDVENAVDQVDGCTGEPLFDMKGLLWALDGGERGGVGA